MILLTIICLPLQLYIMYQNKTVISKFILLSIVFTGKYIKNLKRILSELLILFTLFYNWDVPEHPSTHDSLIYSVNNLIGNNTASRLMYP